MRTTIRLDPAPSLPTEAGLGLMPGVNLDSNSDLLDAMDATLGYRRS